MDLPDIVTDIGQIAYDAAEIGYNYFKSHPSEAYELGKGFTSTLKGAYGDLQRTLNPPLAPIYTTPGKEPYPVSERTAPTKTELSIQVCLIMLAPPNYM